MIETTLIQLERLIKESNNKKEVKTYKHYISLLKDIKRRNITDTDNKAIEAELKSLKIELSTEDYKATKKKLNSFICFAKKQLNLISENHYMTLGMSCGLSIGMAIGMSIGIAFNRDNGLVFGMNIGMIIGMAIGMLIGTIKDTEAKKQDKVLGRTQT